MANPSALLNKYIELGASSAWMLGDDGSGDIDLTDAIGSNGLTLTSGRHALVASSNIVGEASASQFDASTWLNKDNPTGIDLAVAHTVVLYAKWSTLDAGWPAVISDLQSTRYLGFQRRGGFVSSRGETDGANYGARSSETAVDEQWYHIAHTYDGSSTTTLYIDGVEDTGAAEGSGSVGDDTMISVGARDSAGIGSFTGGIQGLAIFPSELSAGNITSLITAAATALATGPARAADRAVNRSINRSI